MNKIILLLKRALSQSEKDLLEKYCSVTYYNDRVHLDGRIVDMLASDILVIPLYNEEVKIWYESQKITIDQNTCAVVLLEACGKKIDPSKRKYGERNVKKHLPFRAKTKEQIFAQLLTEHMPSVRPWYVQIFSWFLHKLF